MKYTKIVATINASTCTEELLRGLYKNGMDVVRLNTAHMEIADMDRIVALVRKVSDKLAIMVDTKGPNIRTCNLDAPLTLKIGDKLDLTGETVPQEKAVQVNYSKFTAEVPVGARIIFDDGAMELLVLGKSGGLLHCEAKRDGELKNHKSVNVPGAELKMPALTRKDRDFIEYAVKNDLDFIAHSFVRSANDVLAVRSILDTGDSDIRIIAKIENRQGVDNLDEILKAADGVMVARGDLGIEIPLEEVPLIQKKLIRACMAAGKSVITATQMLQSMENSPLPTRAEINDVANAVYDGTDAVMLSGETAEGVYPVEAVSVMSRILEETEKSPDYYFTRVREQISDSDENSAFLIHSAVEAAERLPVRAIVCNTASGLSARLCAAYRPRKPIFAFSYNPGVVRQLSLTYGVYAGYNAFAEDVIDLTRQTCRTLIEEKRLAPDDKVAMLAKNSQSMERNNLFCLGAVKDFI